MDNSSDAIDKVKKMQDLINGCYIVQIINLLGCSVGTCWANLSSLSICNNVVLPALSKPRNNNLPDFFHRPIG